MTFKIEQHIEDEKPVYIKIPNSDNLEHEIFKFSLADAEKLAHGILETTRNIRNGLPLSDQVKIENESTTMPSDDHNILIEASRILRKYNK
jgi:hypothetical protein